MNFSHVIAAVAVAIFITSCGSDTAGQIAFETAKVEKTKIGSSITATGTIEPVVAVEVGTQVSGIINKIYVDYNSPVKKGQVIAELDKTNLLSQLNTAKSNLQSMKSNLDYQTLNYQRMATLYQKGLISANDYDQAKLTYIQAKESYASQQENVATTQTNLSYATITSPIDGVILSKAVEEGQTVAASFSTPTLFTIAQDLTNMQVVAKVDEADIGNVREGQRVEFTVDAFPDETFSGSVTQVRQEGTTENNVVTYEVVISAPNNDLKLKPGLTASVTIYTLERENIVSVPTKALRFTPTAETVGKDIKIVDAQGTHKLWIKEGNTLKAYAVQTGITNGTRTEIVSGVGEGKEVVVDATVATEEATATTQEKSPFAPGPRKSSNSQSSKQATSK